VFNFGGRTAPYTFFYDGVAEIKLTESALKNYFFNSILGHESHDSYFLCLAYSMDTGLGLQIAIDIDRRGQNKQQTPSASREYLWGFQSLSRKRTVSAF